MTVHFKIYSAYAGNALLATLEKPYSGLQLVLYCHSAVLKSTVETGRYLSLDYDRSIDYIRI